MKKIVFFTCVILLGISIKFSGAKTASKDKQSSQNVAYYSVTGDKLPGPKPGLMIVKTGDGNARKVVMR